MARSTARSSGTKKASPTRKSTKNSESGSTGNAVQKKAAQKKTVEKKAAPKKSARKSASKGDAPRAESRPTPRAGQVAARAAEELLELTGKGVEGVTGLERTDDGWTVQVEVVEVRRIPDTTDVLALYEIDTDRQGALEGYRRIRRYARGAPGED